MKSKLIVAFISLAALFAPASVLAANNTVQQQIDNSLKCGSNFQIPAEGQQCSVEQSSNDLNNKIKKIINIMSAVVGVVAVAMIIVGGFRYVTSGGNDTSVTSAKNTILYAIIGLVIVAMSQILVHFTIKSLSG